MLKSPTSDPHWARPESVRPTSLLSWWLVFRVSLSRWEQADACYTQIRSALTMTFPDGNPVAEFMLHFHDDGTAGWRWHDEPFDTVNP